WALLLWVPPLLLRLPAQRRFIALVAVMGLALPYFQQSDLLFLLVLPIGWARLFCNLGYLMHRYGWFALQSLAVMWLMVYINALLPAVRSLTNRFLTRVLYNKFKSA